MYLIYIYIYIYIEGGFILGQENAERSKNIMIISKCCNVAQRRGSYDLVGPSHTPTTRSLFPGRGFIGTWLDMF